MALIGHWKLDGNALDSSGYGNNATSSNMVFGSGKLGEARTSGYATVSANTQINVKGEMSLAFWFKPSTAGARRVVMQTAYAGSFCINHETEGDLRFYNGNNTTYDSLDSSVLTNGTWYHCIITRDRNKRTTWYLNGDTNTSRTSAYDGGTRQDNMIIGYGYTGNEAAGIIDDVRLYDHTLSTKEIKELSRAKVLHYGFDDFQEPTENLVSNGSFSTGDLTSWDIGSSNGVSIVSSDLDGDYCVQEIDTDGGWEGVHQNIGVVGTDFQVGDKLTISYYHKSSTSDKNAWVGIYNTTDSTWVGNNTTDSYFYWTRTSYTYTIQSDDSGDTLRVYCYGHNGTTGTIWYDQIQVELKDHATPFVDGTREGTVCDYSGQDNHTSLDLNITPKWTSDTIIGTGAYEFDGTQYIDFNSNILFANEDWTLTGWFNSNSITSNQNFVGANAYDANINWASIYQSKLALWIHQSSEPNRGWHFGNTTLSTGVWYHFALTYDGNGNYAYYLNGNLDTNWPTFNTELSTATIRYIGNYNDLYRPFLGILTDIQIYSTALSENYIQTLYKVKSQLDNNGNYWTKFFNTSPSEEGLRSYWPFNEGSGTITNDVESGNDLTLVNNPIWRKAPIDNALEFNGTSNYIMNSSFKNVSDPIFSIDMWIKRTGTLSAAGYWGIGGNNINNGINSYTPSVRPNKISFDLWGRTTFDTGIDYPLNEWVHVVWVKHALGFSTSTLKIYINGEEKPLVYTFRNNSSTVSLLDGIAFGRISTTVNGYYAPGLIASPKYYNRVLTEQEIRNSYFEKEGILHKNNLSEDGPTYGLKGLWRLDGDAYDYEGTNDGTINGAIVTAGLKQRAYLFDGVNDSIVVPYLQTSSHTVVFWAKSNIVLSTSTSSAYRKTVLKGNGHWNPGIWLTFGVIRAHAATKYTDILWTGDTNWHQIGQAYDADTNSLYVILDGELLTGNETTYGPGNPVELIIGNETIGGTAYPWDGKIQEVRIYDRSISSEELKILYNLTVSDKKEIEDKDTIYIQGEFIED